MSELRNLGIAWVRRCWPTPIVAAALVSPLPAQQRIMDTGTLIISRAGSVIGREEFTVRGGRASTGREGFTISASVFYPPERAEANLTPIVELGPDSQPAALQLDVSDGQQRRVYAELGPRRVSVRIVSPSGESVREYPGGDRLLLADDSSFALYAVPPGHAPGRIHVLWPRAGRRESRELEDRGSEVTVLGAGTAQLHHLVLRTQAEERHLWYDQAGRLMKVEIPVAGLSAVRAPGPPR